MALFMISCRAEADLHAGAPCGTDPLTSSRLRRIATGLGPATVERHERGRAVSAAGKLSSPGPSEVYPVGDD
jgi:hypothetical protein